MRNYIMKYWGLVFVIVLSFWAVKPLFAGGFFPMHDDTQVTRVFEMGKALRDGMFPVRWVNDLGYGYGYPIFNFYAPLAYYVGGIFVLMGMNALLATKIMMGMGIIMAGVSMYLFARQFFSEPGGIVSSMFYQYALYHAVDIYIRGDIGEFWAYAFIPLFFYGIYKLAVQQKIKDKFWKWIVVTAVALACLILSHNLTALIVAIFTMPYIIFILFFVRQKWKTGVVILTAIIFGMLLAAFYIVPLPFEIQYTNVLSQIGGPADYHKHFVCWSQFLYSAWGYGGSGPGCIDGMSFMLGKLTLLLSITGGLSSLIIWKKQKFLSKILLLSFLGWIVALFLTTEQSKIIWETIPGLAMLQYPWRFLLMASFFSAILAGGVWYIFMRLIPKRTIGYNLAGILVLLVIFLQGKYFIPQKKLSVTDSAYTAPNTIRWKISKISDEYLPKHFPKPKSADFGVLESFLIYPPAGIVVKDNEKTQVKQAQVRGFIESNVVLGLAYFPAWHYFIDGVAAPYGNYSGKMLVRLPKGLHTLRVVYQQTTSELAGNALSLTGLAGLLLGIILFREKKRIDEKAYS